MTFEVEEMVCEMSLFFELLRKYLCLTFSTFWTICGIGHLLANASRSFHAWSKSHASGGENGLNNLKNCEKNNTWMLVNMKFISNVDQEYLTSEQSEQGGISCSTQEINFIFPSTMYYDYHIQMCSYYPIKTEL